MSNGLSVKTELFCWKSLQITAVIWVRRFPHVIGQLQDRNPNWRWPALWAPCSIGKLALASRKTRPHSGFWRYSVNQLHWWSKQSIMAWLVDHHRFLRNQKIQRCHSLDMCGKIKPKHMICKYVVMENIPINTVPLIGLKMW